MNRNHRLYLAAILAAFPCAAGAQALVNESTLSLNAAAEAARAALEHCRNDGTQVTVTVLDRAGRTKVVLRDDGSNPHSVQHSLNKAYTALTFREPSGEWGRRAVANPGSAGALRLDRIATASGGLPIRAGNIVVGAIGISGSPGAAGSPGGLRDQACAQAGIDRIAKGLGN
jgi:uncharacterized protein GlcG (DUF336 family)